MATLSLTYNTHFTGMGMPSTTAKTSGHVNWWVTSGTSSTFDPWFLCAKCVYDSIKVITHFGPDYPIDFKVSNANKVDVEVWSGFLTYGVIYRMMNGSEVSRTFTIEINNGLVEPVSESFIQETISMLKSAFGSHGAEGFYIANISWNDEIMFLRFKHNGKYLYTSGSNVLSGSFIGGYISFTKNAYLKQENIPLTVNSVTKTYYSRSMTIGNYTTSNNYMTLSKICYYIIWPKFLDDLRKSAYQLGYCGNTSYVNHQDCMTGNTPYSVINGSVINSNIVQGSIPTTQNTISVSLWANSDSSGAIFQYYYLSRWRAVGYEFYRNTAQTQDVTTPTYATIGNTPTLLLRLYPKAVSQRTQEYFYLCMYDEDEGYNSFDTDMAETNPEYNMRYRTPPTDIIRNKTAYQTTLYEAAYTTYHFAEGSEGYKIAWNNGSWLTPVSETTSGDNMYAVTPTGQFPSLAKISFLSTTGESPGGIPYGWVLYSTENRVISGNRDYGTSVRYHLTENMSMQIGGKYSKTGISAMVRDTLIGIGVKKNDFDFINNITDYNPSGSNNKWEDTVDGVTYYDPIAYGSKLASMNDLLEKMTCLHGAAMYKSGRSNTTLYNAKEFLKNQLWSGGREIRGSYRSYLTASGYIRYVKVGSTYYYENTWPIRWVSTFYYWNNDSATSFSSLSNCLVMKASGTTTGEKWAIQNISTTNWNFTGYKAETSLGSKTPSRFTSWGRFVRNDTAAAIYVGSNEVGGTSNPSSLDNSFYYRRSIGEAAWYNTTSYINVSGIIKEVLGHDLYLDNFDGWMDYEANREVAYYSQPYRQATNAYLYTEYNE